jgi:hypothetical protein
VDVQLVQLAQLVKKLRFARAIIECTDTLLANDDALGILFMVFDFSNDRNPRVWSLGMRSDMASADEQSFRSKLSERLVKAHRKDMIRFTARLCLEFRRLSASS